MKTISPITENEIPFEDQICDKLSIVDSVQEKRIEQPTLFGDKFRCGDQMIFVLIKTSEHIRAQLEFIKRSEINRLYSSYDLVSEMYGFPVFSAKK